LASNARCLYIFRLSAWQLLLYGESRPGVGDIVVETDRGSSISVTSDAHTLCISMYFPFVGREPDLVLCQILCISISVLYIDPGLWDIFCQDLFSLSVYLYSVIHDYICILFTSSYTFIVYIFIFSIVISFPLFILSLSFSLYLLDLSLTETVKQTYGQWLVYSEFNTPGFVS